MMTGSARPLANTVALVTGASRGVGRGIAHELGIAGATVYVTGRSRDDGETTDGLPGTIDDCAALVTASGGRGIPAPCDHTDDDALARLAARIADENGKLDILVNNVWGGYEQYDAALFTRPVSEQPVARWDKMMSTGVRAHYTTTRAVLPLMQESSAGLIVEISFGDDGKFLGDVQYDVAKAACTRLGVALASKLRADRISVITVYPGFTRTDRVERGASAEELTHTHSPRFVGRAVVALACDPDVMKRTGTAAKAGQLGLDYGFTDVDGSCPKPYTVGGEQDR